MDLKDVATLAISIAALTVSLIVAARTRRYNRAALAASHRNSYMNALLNLNREIVAHPELWGVYEPEFLPSDHTSPMQIARRRGFIWYHLNLFELFYTDYRERQRDGREPDAAKHWNAWDRFIRWFLRGSAEAQAIVRDDHALRLLHDDFRQYLRHCVAAIPEGK